MATQAQIVANRRNAEKATGPRSPEGKAIVAQNGVTHGLTAAENARPGEARARPSGARSQVIYSESQAEFDLYRDRMLAELAPVGPMESALAERIVSLLWRLKRADRMQNQTIDAKHVAQTKDPIAKLRQSLLSKGLKQPQGDSSAPQADLTLGRLAIKDFANARVLERLLLYERRIENSLYRTILELQRLSLIRKLKPGDEENTYESVIRKKL